MRLPAWTAVLGVVAVISCSANTAVVPTDNDAGKQAGPGIGDASGGNFSSEIGIVFVNGLVQGVAAPNFVLGDVRICIQNVTRYPLPDARPMPLANYPGVGVGQGVDLGTLVNLPSDVTVDVFNATDLEADAAWQPPSQRLECSVITCAPDAGGASCKKHVELHTSLLGGINLIALTDAAQGVDLQSTQLDGGYAGSPDSIRAQLVNESGWHAADEVAATFGDLQHQTTPISLADPLVAGLASTTTTLLPGGDYEGNGIWVSQIVDGAAGDTFQQSLGSIQWVSDPSTAPSTFFDLRENFAFVLVGDPNNTLLEANGRDPSFDGRALHFVAVPFAAAVPSSP